MNDLTPSPAEYAHSSECGHHPDVRGHCPTNCQCLCHTSSPVLLGHAARLRAVREEAAR